MRNSQKLWLSKRVVIARTEKFLNEKCVVGKLILAGAPKNKKGEVC